MELQVRSATPQDFDRIWELIGLGCEYLKQQGLPQWQNGHGPSTEDIHNDIKRGEGYVLTSGDTICGYASLVAGVEPVYEAIHDGAWLPGLDRYTAIHRVVLDPAIRGQGLAKTLLNALLAEAAALGYHDVRIDTHPKNTIMQRLCESVGFTYRGQINWPIPDGERVAYQQQAGPATNR